MDLGYDFGDFDGIWGDNEAKGHHHGGRRHATTTEVFAVGLAASDATADWWQPWPPATTTGEEGLGFFYHLIVISDIKNHYIVINET